MAPASGKRARNRGARNWEANKVDAHPVGTEVDADRIVQLIQQPNELLFLNSEQGNAEMCRPDWVILSWAILSLVIQRICKQW